MGPDGERREEGEESDQSEFDGTAGPHSPYAETEGESDSRSVRSTLRWLRRTDHTAVQLLRETAFSLLIVATVGFLLFAVSGVWPPLVAVESSSMEPHLHKGDLVLVVEEHRFPDPAYTAENTGVVTARVGARHNYTQFGAPGDVIVYRPDGSKTATPIIHRARFWVEEGENWYDIADPAYIQADSCAELPACPAPTAGFITKGDNPVTNDYYDQTQGISTIVKPEWIKGTAVLRIPWLGWIRLAVTEIRFPGIPAALGAP
ncbi:MAG: S26 family signal peptidase [Halodesulfurarchaeum sp.]